jgi:hypothetical protein
VAGFFPSLSFPSINFFSRCFFPLFFLTCFFWSGRSLQSFAAACKFKRGDRQLTVKNFIFCVSLWYDDDILARMYEWFSIQLWNSILNVD